MNYDVVVGLEIHAELSTNTKAFCTCLTVILTDILSLKERIISTLIYQRLIRFHSLIYLFV